MPNLNICLCSLVDRLYALFVQVADHLQSPFLLLLRLIWGIQLMEIGWGKITNIQQPIDYFTNTLHIPFPVENAWLSALTETFGGLFLLLGILSRPMAAVLAINFTVAYLSADLDAVKSLFTSDPDPFIKAAPFIYFAMAVIVLAFGPGAYSVDYVIARWRKTSWKSATI